MRLSMIRRNRGSGVAENRASTSAVMSSSFLLRGRSVRALGIVRPLCRGDRANIIDGGDIAAIFRFVMPACAAMTNEAAWMRVLPLVMLAAQFEEKAMTVTSLPPEAVRAMLRDGAEMALIDVRHHGVSSHELHLFFANSVPLSRLELMIRDLVPRQSTRIVVHDGGGEDL